MEYNQWVQMQQNPNPNSNLSTGQAANHSHNPVSDHYQQPAFDPNNALSQPQPPGVDPPYVPPQYPQPPAAVSYAQPPETVSYAQPPGTVNYAQPPANYTQPPATVTYTQPAATVNYVQQPIGYDPQQSVDAATAAAYYYPDPNVNWAATYSQIGAVNYAAGVSTPTPNITNRVQKRHTGKKGPKKKVVQPAWCEVCKIDCNSSGVLDQHKLGKKHLKNLEKLKAKLAPAPAPAPAHAPAPAPVVTATTSTTPTVIVDPTVVVTAPPAAVAASTFLPDSATAVAPADKPIIGPEENPEKSSSQKSRKRAAARRMDLETKKSRVLAGGADAGSVHACDICNVVCNSATVFKYHLAGKTHASMVKKHAPKDGAAAVAT